MRLLIGLFLTCSLVLPPLAAADGVELRVEQQLGVAEDGTVTSRDSEEAVRFRMTVDYRCPGEESSASLFLSVGNEAVAAEAAESPQAVIVTVPAGQLAGTRESAECAAPGTRVLEGQAQVFATLSCVTGEERVNRTVVAPLSVWFNCPAEAAE
jgi:hypothetical protein